MKLLRRPFLRLLSITFVLLVLPAVIALIAVPVLAMLQPVLAACVLEPLVNAFPAPLDAIGHADGAPQAHARDRAAEASDRLGLDARQRDAFGATRPHQLLLQREEVPARDLGHHEVEQDHIVDAYTFELAKCYEQTIKERQLQCLANIDPVLCAEVATGRRTPSGAIVSNTPAAVHAGTSIVS